MIVDVLVIKYCNLGFICYLVLEIWNFIVSRLVREQSLDNLDLSPQFVGLHR
jgi:hypothetical protein